LLFPIFWAERMKGKNVFAAICMFIISILCVSSLFAEIKVFEKEVEEVVGRDQSQEQVEAFALRKAKRLAVEEAGTYISSLTVVQNYHLAKDEVTALASGIVQSQIVGIPVVTVKNGMTHVMVKARIAVDTGILDQQIKDIMKEKGTLKKLEESQQKVKELEDKLSSLKSSEVKRLEELNTQAIALERERENQRIAREVQAIKARGELKKAELERLQKEREMQERTRKIIAEQEKARKEEVDALAREQDRIKKAQLENEQRWNELARKALLSQSAWTLVDDSLSFKQAMDEANQLKQEIAAFIQRMDFQFKSNVENLKKAYTQQIDLTTVRLPLKPAEKDPFETTVEYNKRLAAYDHAVKQAREENEKVIEKLKAEENYNTIIAKIAYLKQKTEILAPFVNRIDNLQDKRFLLPEGVSMTVSLGEPDADQSRFTLTLKYKGQSWTKYWEYTDRNYARDLYRTRTYLKAEGMFQMDGSKNGNYLLTAARVTHLSTGESRIFPLQKPNVFSEINDLKTTKKELLIYSTFQALEGALGMEHVFVKGGCFNMGDNFGHRNKDEKPIHSVCVNDFFIGKYEVTQGQWKAIMGSNPSYFSSCGYTCPVESVSWNDAQHFIQRLNQKTGNQFRLPTEAEWEYATRSGGKNEKYAGTSSESYLGNYAWYTSNSGNTTHPVGKKQPNALGIYDMSGNVWEWVQDWYGKDYYSNGPRDNPIGPPSGQYRVLRGGFWGSDPEGVRSSNRSNNDPSDRSGSYGFRVVSSSR